MFGSLKVIQCFTVSKFFEADICIGRKIYTATEVKPSRRKTISTGKCCFLQVNEGAGT
ncbi:hypothetical protein Scep_001481 [Stephania cephalantha]|uniref:Uncharacterized protein n=1 Tax=Stephania cephalantha TaxID=152367 RepID=A0AAP0LAV7_9MAGN